MRWKKTGQDGSSRLGVYHTEHGDFSTPNFMPVGTKASVKGIDCERLTEMGAQITLVNTYHLTLRPGEKLVRELGGIHEFSGWKGPILSDSGGFQVYSLEGIRKISEEGVEFRSHIDGTKCFLSPERSIQIQEELGVDIAMAFDECPDARLGRDEMLRSIERTHRWEERSLGAKTRKDMSLFGITQGGIDLELRSLSAETLKALPFDGFAIGGLSVGEPPEEMYRVLRSHVQELPNDKIRYLMGVGTPRDIVEAVSEGVDLFDCVMPTRSGRFGRAFVNGTSTPYVNIKNAQYRTEPRPLDEACACLACRNYSCAYLHHLFRCKEMLGPILLSIHNLTHYLALMAEIRVAIQEGRFREVFDRVKAQSEGESGSRS